jgi:hypothetical protein
LAEAWFIDCCFSGAAKQWGKGYAAAVNFQFEQWQCSLARRNFSGVCRAAALPRPLFFCARFML